MVRYNRHEVYNLVPLCMGMGLVPERVSDTVPMLVAVQALGVQLFRCKGIGLAPEQAVETVLETVSETVLALVAVQAHEVQMFRCKALLAAAVLHDLHSVPGNTLSGSVVYMRALVLSEQGADSSDSACQVPASNCCSVVLASRHGRHHCWPVN